MTQANTTPRKLGTLFRKKEAGQNSDAKRQDQRQK